MDIPRHLPPAAPRAGGPPVPMVPPRRPAVDTADAVSAAGPAPPADAPDPLRAARIAAIRDQIAAGTYDTDDRFDAALDGLLADLSE